MNYLETIKNITKNKEKRVENIIFLIILLVVIFIATKYIFKPKEVINSNSTSNNKNIDNSSTANISKTTNDNTETKLSNILSQISGISDVSVVLTYSQDTKQNLVYNTKEISKAGETTKEKEVAYNEQGNNKTAIVETIEMPKIEGAIVVAKGANTVDIKSKIANAIASVTSVPIYKIQVFEKNG